MMETEKKNKIEIKGIKFMKDVQFFALTIGVPGSGKSTYLKKTNLEIVSRDVIRFAILDKYHTDDYFSHEDEVWTEFVNTIVEAINDGKSVVADATHLSKGSRRKLLNAVMPRLKNKEERRLVVLGLYFDVPLDVCLERNAQRTGRAFVPEDQIRNMYASLTRPDETEGIDYELVINEKGIPELFLGLKESY